MKYLITLLLFIISITTYSQKMEFKSKCNDKNFDPSYKHEWEVWSKDNPKMKFYYHDGDDLNLTHGNWYVINLYIIDSCGVKANLNELLIIDNDKFNIKNPLQDGPDNYDYNNLYYYKAKQGHTLVQFATGCVGYKKV